LTFLFDQRSARPRFGFADDSCAQIGINAHLLSWHSIKNEPRTNFCNSFRTFCYDHELNNFDNREYYEANNEITADHHLTKSFYGLAGMRVEAMFNESRSSVVNNNNNDGKVDSPSDVGIQAATNTNRTLTPMFRTIKASSKNAGIGSTISAMIATTNAASTKSPLTDFESILRIVSMIYVKAKPLQSHR
jgi:hypothetical protein